MARKNKPMTVGQLVNELSQFHEDTVVEMASDAEGNAWHYVFSVEDGDSEETGEPRALIIPE